VVQAPCDLPPLPPARSPRRVTDRCVLGVLCGATRCPNGLLCFSPTEALDLATRLDEENDWILEAIARCGVRPATPPSAPAAPHGPSAAQGATASPPPEASPPSRIDGEPASGGSSTSAGEP
jgi:hypothetical protein